MDGIGQQGKEQSCEEIDIDGSEVVASALSSLAARVVGRRDVINEAPNTINSNDFLHVFTSVLSRFSRWKGPQRCLSNLLDDLREKDVVRLIETASPYINPHPRQWLRQHRGPVAATRSLSSGACSRLADFQALLIQTKMR